MTKNGIKSFYTGVERTDLHNFTSEVKSNIT